MLDSTAFSALRLSRVFSPSFLAEYPYYSEVGDDFDIEYLGGQWEFELIDGVRFWYPAAGTGKLGIVEVWSCPQFATASARDHPGLDAGWLVPDWTTNANRALEAIEFPARLGNAEAVLQKMAAGRVLRFPYPAEWYGAARMAEDGSLAGLHFACRTPDLYHVNAVVHATAGVLQLEIRRPDLIRKNGPEGSYDLCFGGLYDEQPARNTRRKRG